MVVETAITQAIAPAGPEQAENDAFASLIAEFDNATDTRKIDYLKHRYAGFGKKDSATLAGVKLATANGWIKNDPRVAHFDNQVSTGKRRELRKDVLQEEWYRNFHLVIEQDAYILKKVHGLLEEPFLDINSAGEQVTRMGSPPMTKRDWDYFSQMRKMYTPDAWASIEKAVSGQDTIFNISEFVLNMPTNQQINNAPA